jgi:hypothetical protein
MAQPMYAMRLATSLGALALSGIAVVAGAHSGGLNSEGCHNNRRTGDYHCHRGNSAPPQVRRPQQFFGSGPVHFPNCASARAAGAAPLRRGDPGYRPGLDRDDDGVACE